MRLAKPLRRCKLHGLPRPRYSLYFKAAAQGLYSNGSLTEGPNGICFGQGLHYIESSPIGYPRNSSRISTDPVRLFNVSFFSFCRRWEILLLRGMHTSLSASCSLQSAAPVDIVLNARLMQLVWGAIRNASCRSFYYNAQAIREGAGVPVHEADQAAHNGGLVVLAGGLPTCRYCGWLYVRGKLGLCESETGSSS